MKNFLWSSEHPELKKNLHRIQHLVSGSTPVFIHGPLGCGKRSLAGYIHELGDLREHSFNILECHQESQSTLEEELFGGGDSQQGLLETTPKGTIVFQNCESINAALQTRLLRLIEEKAFFRGPEREDRVTFEGRLIFVSTQDPQLLLKKNILRNDFFFRISIFQIFIPPLEQRRADFQGLAQNIFKQLCEQESSWKTKVLSSAAVEVLKNRSYPGGLRELKACLEQALLHSGTNSRLEATDFGVATASLAAPVARNLKLATDELGTLREARDEFEKQFISKTLEKTQGNKTKAAKILGLSREGLRKALNKKAA